MRDPFANVTSQGWQTFFDTQRTKPYYQELLAFLDEEFATHEIFPAYDDIATAFRLTPFEELNVVLLGQDPYHDHNQAHGLAFSVKSGVKTPPSLKNIFKELSHDLSMPLRQNSELTGWARQGVLLINSVLTVQAHKAASHKNRGWETFTNALIDYINSSKTNIVYILWGSDAIKKTKRITHAKNCIITSVHPSPLSAYRGFFNSKPFSQTNAYLQSIGKTPIDWYL